MYWETIYDFQKVAIDGVEVVNFAIGYARPSGDLQGQRYM